MSRSQARTAALGGVAALVLSAVALAPTAGAGPAVSGRSTLEDPGTASEVRIRVSGSAELDQLMQDGFDIEHGAQRVPDGIEAVALASADDVAQLEARGAEILSEAEAFSWDAVNLSSMASAPTLAVPQAAPTPHEDSVRVVRADWFTTKGQGFLYVEARTAEGAQEDPVVTMTLTNDSGAGTPFAFPRTMSRFVDSGEYMFHRNLYKLDVRPDKIQVTSSTGGVATGDVSDWLEDAPPPLTDNPGYQSDFVDGYRHPYQLYERFEEIAEQYPNIAEIIELPYQTNGYQRQAQAVIGGTGPSAVVVSSAAWGHEGGNDVTVEFEPQDGANQPLAVDVVGSAVTVRLATDAAGAASSTVSDVAAALEADSDGLIGRAHAYRTNTGAGIVAPTAEPVALTDFLDQKREGAPEGEVPRGPATIKLLRIGKFRDGRNPGVLIQAQDHAREWVPATTTLEAAERLVQNYATDKDTRKIVDNTDIFLIPSNNPDGANYSFFNFASQRKNMTNHCPDSDADPGRRNQWGVDLNRNYRVASGHDGYDGGSFSCTSGTYQGPAELSEPESQNIVWLAETFRNIKFMMSVHSNGGQLFWQPGAYMADGRITTPRPPLGDEAFYWQSASRILSQVKNFRETVVTPENVGGSSDVLYSSAGNVREDLYYTYGIYAFGWEVGGSVYNPDTGSWQGGSFQPPWAGIPDLVSGHSETMEYANGLMEMFRIAAEWGKDHRKPTSTLVREAHDDGIDVSFTTSEPATIYYTTDGSVPTLESPRYAAVDFREPPEVFHVTETTTFRWFSVDSRGLVERGYDPQDPDSRHNYRTETVAVR